MTELVATWDFAILLAYMAAVMAFGIWIGRNQRDARDYFLCDHNLPWWAILGSIVATETSTATFLSVPGLAFDPHKGDLRFLQLAMGYVIGRVLVSAWLLPHYFRRELFTTYELLNQRFGAPAKILSSVLFMVTRTIADGLRLYLAAIVMEQVTPLPISWCIFVIGLITIVYTVVGGLRSVVWNDCIQLIVYMLGAVAAAVVIVNQLPDGWHQVARYGMAHHKFRIIHWSLDPADPFTILSGVIGGAFLTMATHGSDQMMVQRVLGARNLREGSLAMVLSGVVVFLQFLLFLLLGVGLAAFYDQYPPGQELVGDRAFSHFIAVHLPVGIRGLTLSAVFAAAMSTLSSSLNSSASAAYNDLLRPRNSHEQSRGNELTTSRALTVVFGLAQIAVGLATAGIREKMSPDDLSHVVNDVLAIAGFTSGVVLGVFLLGFWTTQVHQKGALVGLVGGLIVMLGVKFRTDIAWTWYAVIGPLVTVALGLLASRLIRRPVASVVLLALVTLPTFGDGLPIVSPEALGLSASRLDQIAPMVNEAIRAGEMPGCVVAIGRHGKLGYLQAFGDRQSEPNREPMTVDTVFDMASITKPVATATSVMILADAGKIRLDDPVSRYLPEFTGAKKETITVRQLLLHEGGLVPDNSLQDYGDGSASAWQRICELELTAPPGTKFIYSDVGFIVLGKLIERVSGMSLDAFARRHLFTPLGMQDTGFLPAEALRARAAATEKRDGTWMKGVVHDPRAHALGGVAGHAGLFSTAGDLAIYAHMMLRGGTAAGQRVLTEDAVQQMTRSYEVSGGQRGLGWDKRSTYSSNRGDLLSDRAFGHGGFTGTVLWIDPQSDLFYVFLSSRLHPDGNGTINPLAGRIGTIASAAIIDSDDKTGTPAATTSADFGTSPVRTGLDVLQDSDFRQLSGRRVGLITNQTGVNRTGRSAAQLLHQSGVVTLVAIFSPEHGPQGTLDVATIPDSTDAETGLPIYSLYGAQRSPSAESLRDLDTLVFDIQDIGARYYTYISTMGLAMEAAAEHGKRFVVLDRPNPIGGVICEGPLPDDDQRSFVSFHSLPVRHAMTIGELAQMFRGERKLKLDLEVVRMEGWRRSDYFDRTELTWVNPSPNMRSLTQALLYPGIGWMETTNLSVGRGTDTPFEVLGAPWLDGPRLARALNHAGLPGVRFVPVRFTPRESKFAGEPCGGIQILVTQRSSLQPVLTGLTIAHFLRQHHPSDWQSDSLLHLLSNRGVVRALLDGTPPAEIVRQIEPSLSEFRKRRTEFLLYP